MARLLSDFTILHICWWNMYQSGDVYLPSDSRRARLKQNSLCIFYFFGIRVVCFGADWLTEWNGKDAARACIYFLYFGRYLATLLNKEWFPTGLSQVALPRMRRDLPRLLWNAKKEKNTFSSQIPPHRKAESNDLYILLRVKQFFTLDFCKKIRLFMNEKLDTEKNDNGWLAEGPQWHHSGCLNQNFSDGCKIESADVLFAAKQHLLLFWHSSNTQCCGVTAKKSMIEDVNILMSVILRLKTFVCSYTDEVFLLPLMVESTILLNVVGYFLLLLDIFTRFICGYIIIFYIKKLLVPEDSIFLSFFKLAFSCPW